MPIDPPATDRPPLRRFRDPGVRPIATTLGELRARIDELDTRIVGLLAERGALVRDATRFKADPVQVHAAQRQAEVFARVRELAAQAAPDLPMLPDVVESAYRSLVAGFVAAEQRFFLETLPVETP